MIEKKVVKKSQAKLEKKKEIRLKKLEKRINRLEQEADDKDRE